MKVCIVSGSSSFGSGSCGELEEVANVLKEYSKVTEMVYRSGSEVYRAVRFGCGLYSMVT